MTENAFYKYLHLKKGKYSAVTGFPNTFWFRPKMPLWNNLPYHILVMENLGPDLQLLLKQHKRPFSTKTVLMLAYQILQRIKYLHEEGYIHRDIKPENLLTGLGKDKHIVYLADFGLAKKNKEIYYENAGLIGTPRYASINTHLGISQSRRDDMESIGYVLMLFQSGSLPWYKYDKKDSKIIADLKKQTAVEDLCKGCYKEFHMYLHYCRGLRFDEKPDYDYLQKLFTGLFLRLGHQYDNKFDWTLELKKRPPRPVDSLLLV